MEKMVISGGIGYEISPQNIRDQLSKMKGQDIDVHIASPGGWVFEGLEIFNMFRDYKRENPGAQLMLTIKGLAASMATYLAVNEAFDLIAAEDNAVFMIHNPFNITVGDYREMQKNSDFLKGLADLLADAYVKKTGKSKAKISEMMDDETWLFGDEIKEAGFVDEIIKTDEKKEKASAVSTAKLSFNAIIDKMKASENAKADYAKAAALIGSNKSSENPADAGNNKQEETSMTLDEFLKANPAAKTEYDEKIKASFDDGEKAVRATVAKAAPFMGSASTYPKQIQDLAVDVVKGDKPLDALLTTVTVFDAMNEKKASDAAKDESDEKKDVRGEQGQTKVTDNGEIKTEMDFDAEIKRSKEIGLGR